MSRIHRKNRRRRLRKQQRVQQHTALRRWRLRLVQGVARVLGAEGALNE